MKYVMLRVSHTFKEGDTIERLVPVIFPDLICHDDMALFFGEAIRASMGEKDGVTVTAENAGFANVFVSHVHGDSVTLGLKHRREDKAVINHYDYSHGIV